MQTALGQWQALRLCLVCVPQVAKADADNLQKKRKLIKSEWAAAGCLPACFPG